MPLAKHILFIGDSTTRGPFCVLVWEVLHGTVEGGPCNYNSPNYRDEKWHHKFTSKVIDAPEGPRNVSFSCLWAPTFLAPVTDVLLSLTDPPPTHVVFNVGLYNVFDKITDISWRHDEREELQKSFMDLLAFMKQHFSNSVEHIILRTTLSVVTVHSGTSLSLISKASHLFGGLFLLSSSWCRWSVSGRFVVLSKRWCDKASWNL